MPCAPRPGRRRTDPDRLKQARHAIDDLVQRGFVEPHPRSDGQIGYWPTEAGMHAANDPTRGPRSANPRDRREAERE